MYLTTSHTDHNLGYVLTLPIKRDTWIAARPRADRVAGVLSLDVTADSTFHLDGIERDSLAPVASCLHGVGVSVVLFRMLGVADGASRGGSAVPAHRE